MLFRLTFLKFISGKERDSPFDVSEDINNKLVLWSEQNRYVRFIINISRDGDLLALSIDAIVNTTNERLTDNSLILYFFCLHFLSSYFYASFESKFTLAGLAARVSFHAGPVIIIVFKCYIIACWIFLLLCFNLFLIAIFGCSIISF